MSKAMPPEEAIEEQAQAAGYHIPGVYREKCRERAPVGPELLGGIFSRARS